MKLIEKSNFRVEGMFYSTIVLRKIKTRHTLKKALMNPPYFNWYSFLVFMRPSQCLVLLIKERRKNNLGKFLIWGGGSRILKVLCYFGNHF